MRNKKKYYFTLFFLMFMGSHLIVAQDIFNEQGLPTVKIDLDKGTISGEFPFDEFIKIEVTSKNSKLAEEVSMFEVVYVRETKVIDNKELKKRVRRTKRGKTVKSKEFSITPISIKLKPNKYDKKLYEGVIAPLLPDKSYELIFIKSLNSKETATFYQVINLISEGKTDKASILFEQKIKPLDIQLKRDIKVSVMQSFNFLKDTLFIDLKELLCSDKIPFQSSPAEVLASDIEKYMAMLTAKKIPTSAFAEAMYSYTKSGGEDNNEVLKGLRSLGSDTISKGIEIEKRKKNIKKSYAELQKLEKNFRSLISHHATDEDLAKFYQDVIINYKNSLKTNDSIISSLSKSANKLITKYYSYSALVTNNTISKQDDDGKLAYLVPDVGFINAWGEDGIGDIEYIGRPYLGLNWHLTGYNKNKKLSQLAQKRFWSRFSISAGITLGNIDEGQYEDLFSGLSVSAGLNMRLAKNVRIGVGGLLLRYNRNPIVEKEGVTALPYLSISFDNKFFGDFAIFKQIFN